LYDIYHDQNRQEILQTSEEELVELLNDCLILILKSEKNIDKEHLLDLKEFLDLQCDDFEVLVRLILRLSIEMDNYEVFNTLYDFIDSEQKNSLLSLILENSVLIRRSSPLLLDILIDYCENNAQKIEKIILECEFDNLNVDRLYSWTLERKIYDGHLMICQKLDLLNEALKFLYSNMIDEEFLIQKSFDFLYCVKHSLLYPFQLSCCRSIIPFKTLMFDNVDLITKLAEHNSNKTVELLSGEDELMEVFIRIIELMKPNKRAEYYSLIYDKFKFTKDKEKEIVKLFVEEGFQRPAYKLFTRLSFTEEDDFQWLNYFKSHRHMKLVKFLAFKLNNLKDALLSCFELKDRQIFDFLMIYPEKEIIETINSNLKQFISLDPKETAKIVSSLKIEFPVDDSLNDFESLCFLECLVSINPNKQKYSLSLLKTAIMVSSPVAISIINSNELDSESFEEIVNFSLSNKNFKVLSYLMNQQIHFEKFRDLILQLPFNEILNNIEWFCENNDLVFTICKLHPNDELIKKSIRASSINALEWIEFFKDNKNIDSSKYILFLLKEKSQQIKLLNNFLPVTNKDLHSIQREAYLKTKEPSIISAKMPVEDDEITIPAPELLNELNQLLCYKNIQK
ncbi:hypothetical protein ROZALSC1DRAFT_31145, partial [Rozella allomycis CSF55]